MPNKLTKEYKTEQRKRRELSSPMGCQNQTIKSNTVFMEVYLMLVWANTERILQTTKVNSQFQL